MLKQLCTASCLKSPKLRGDSPWTSQVLIIQDVIQYQCLFFLCKSGGNRFDLLAARKFTAPATSNFTACSNHDTILDIGSCIAEEEEEFAQSSFTPDNVEIDEVFAVGIPKPFSLLMREMTF